MNMFFSLVQIPKFQHPPCCPVVQSNTSFPICATVMMIL